MAKTDTVSQKENSNEKQETGKFKLVPSFEKEQDIKIAEINPDLEVTTDEQGIIDEICPHYDILRKRYREYKNPDPTTGTPNIVPLRVDRTHELATFEAVLGQAATLANIKAEPIRLIKCFVYEGEERKTKLIIDKQVSGTRINGEPTTLAIVRVGYYRYPKQFMQDNDQEWSPVNNRFEKVWYIDWDQKEAEKLSKMSNPKEKYCVWHPDTTLPINKKYYRREQFLSMTDEEQIKDIEDIAKNKQAR